MRKPDSLRAAIVAAVPGLSRDPDRFLVFVKSGQLVGRASPGADFEMRYTLTVGLLNFPGDPALAFATVRDWVLTEQPELLTPAFDNGGITFAADILDGETADVSIELKLTEAVRISTCPDGTRVITYAEEPSDAMLGLFAAAGADIAPLPPLEEVWTSECDRLV